VLDVCAYKDGRLVELLYMKNLTSKDTKHALGQAECELKRFVLPLDVTETEVGGERFIKRSLLM